MVKGKEKILRCQTLSEKRIHSLSEGCFKSIKKATSNKSNQ